MTLTGYQREALERAEATLFQAEQALRDLMQAVPKHSMTWIILRGAQLKAEQFRADLREARRIMEIPETR